MSTEHDTKRAQDEREGIIAEYRAIRDEIERLSLMVAAARAATGNASPTQDRGPHG